MCPEVRLPRKSQSAVSGSRTAVPRGAEAEGRELFQRISSEVFELGRQAPARGSSVRREDLLQRLGAPPPKKQRMPFRMAMGVRAAQAKRTRKETEQARESGVVLAKAAGPAKRRRERDANDVGLGIPRGVVVNARARAGAKRSRTRS